MFLQVRFAQDSSPGLSALFVSNLIMMAGCETYTLKGKIKLTHGKDTV